LGRRLKACPLHLRLAAYDTPGIELACHEEGAR
jgi:hypothetical protein